MAKQLPKQVQVAVDWAKSNSLIAVFAGMVIVVPVGCYFAADWFGESVRAEADGKAKSYTAVSSALNSSAELPIPGGESVRLEGLPNEKTVEEFRKILEGAKADSSGVYTVALSRNKGTPAHEPVVANSVFPNYPKNFGDADRVRTLFVRALNKRYEDLLKDINAGSPPQGSLVAEKVSAVEKRFIADAGVDSLDKIKDEAERQKQKDILAKQLLDTRLGVCNEVALNISMYAALSALTVPSEDDPAIAGLFKDMKDADAQDRMLFDLQWQYWIAADVLRAFEAANGGTENSVLKNPVKRLVSLRVLPMEAVSAAPAAGEASTMGGAEVPAEGAATGTEGEAAPADGGSAPAPAATLGPPAIDNTVEAARDFAKRFTGRVSNGVYDVRLAEVTFVAETSKLPLVFAKLADENFMTITNVRIAPADAFAAARSGFVYGIEPVSEVTATIETVWFREWTAEFMPAVLRTALGIQSKSPESATSSDSETSTQGG
jgi:hypothetical protein